MCVRGGVVSDAGEGEFGDDEGGVVVGFVVVPAFAGVVAVGGLVVAALGAELFVGGGVAAGFGGEVAAEAEHVCPSAESAVGGFPLVAW